MKNPSFHLLSIAGTALATLLVSPAIAAASADASAMPPFMASQAAEGMKVYTNSCQACHGAKLEGLAGPALTGPQFTQKWVNGSASLQDFHRAVKTQMPVGAPGTLPARAYLDVVAFILSRNGYMAGSESLTESNMALVLRPASGADAESAPDPRSRKAFPVPSQTVTRAKSGIPDDTEMASPKEADWLMYNHTFDGRRYSTLKQITNKNAGRLTATCLVQLGEVGWFQANPVVYNGIMYVTSPYNTYAINAKTCEKLWTRLYPEDNTGVTTPVRVTRGTTIYKGKLYRSTPNGHFLALDAQSGEILWDVLLADVYHGYWLSAAPIAYDSKVIIGEAGADWGANAHIFALDADTGNVVWKFNVIPTGKEEGAGTWKNGAEHGGGASWSTYTLNLKEGNLYVSVGNPAPSFNGVLRPGDNLFTDSVVVLDFKSGRLKWFAQQVAHDTHDWDTADAPVVYALNGKEYMAVGNKAGWLYIYDRTSHKLLSKTAVTTQENMDAPITREGTHHCPGSQGGVEWNGPAFSPEEGLLFINSVDWCGTSTLSANRYVEGAMYYDGAYKLDPRSEAKGWTRAFNAASGKELWSRKSTTPMTSAVTATAGAVVFTGDLNGYFLALDSTSGDTVYQFNTGGGIAGAAATYLVEGKQYVAITSGNNSKTIWNDVGNMTVVVFSLPDNVRQVAWIVAISALNTSAYGANLAPSDRDVSSAIQAGRVLAATHGGYPMKEHIAWAVPDSRNLYPALGDVDAVLIATPLERATQAGFLAALSGSVTSLAEVRKSKDLKPGWLQIILFTHGPDAKDESYVTRFSIAKLTFANTTLVASETETSDPSDSTYPLAGEKRQRQVATIRLRFDLTAYSALQSAPGRLQFSDDQGKFFDLSVELGKYR